jgi:hypothetical protein
MMGDYFVVETRIIIPAATRDQKDYSFCVAGVGVK